MKKKSVDGRHKAGHDDAGLPCRRESAMAMNHRPASRKAMAGGEWRACGLMGYRPWVFCHEPAMG
jgi:hypothetical protein